MLSGQTRREVRIAFPISMIRDRVKEQQAKYIKLLPLADVLYIQMMERFSRVLLNISKCSPVKVKDMYGEAMRIFQTVPSGAHKDASESYKDTLHFLDTALEHKATEIMLSQEEFAGMLKDDSAFSSLEHYIEMVKHCIKKTEKYL